MHDGGNKLSIMLFDEILLEDGPWHATKSLSGGCKGISEPSVHKKNVILTRATLLRM